MQVHEREGDIAEYVDRAQLQVELDGIEYHRGAIEHHDVSQVQIAVALAYATGGDSLGHPCGLRPCFRPGPAVKRVQARPVARRIHVPAHREEVFLRPALDLRGPAELGHRARRLLMQPGHFGGQLIHDGYAQFAAERKPIESEFRIETAHPHGKLEHVRGLTLSAVASDARRLDRSRDADDIEVEAWRGAPVQADLVLAGLASLLECGEVQEAEVQRLLELVGMLPCKQHRRNVRVDALDMIDRFGIRLRPQQPAHQGLMPQQRRCLVRLDHRREWVGPRHRFICQKSPSREVAGVEAIPL